MNSDTAQLIRPRSDSSTARAIIAIGGDADLVVLTPDLQIAGVMTRGGVL